MKTRSKIVCVFLSFTFLCNAQQINQNVLDEIKKKSLQSHSDALIIKKDGEIIYSDFFGKNEDPIYIASAGKSLASLAIGKLIDLKLLDSLDQPIYSIYPEWNQGSKKDITVRMLMNHTSGIQNNPNASIELEPAPDYKIQNIIKLALAAELTAQPGMEVSYNNKAVALLGGIVHKLSGKPFDQFFEEAFFKPLEIANFNWIKDKSGNPTLHGAFVIKPSDLIKFGDLILNKGLYEGKRIISEWWINESLKASQDFTPIWGLLWWRLPEYEKRIIDDSIWLNLEDMDVSQDFLSKIEDLKGITFETKFQFYEALRSRLGDNWGQILNTNLPVGVEISRRIYSQDILAYYADGFRGNFLVVVPESNIVAVRCADNTDFNYQTDFFQDFVSLVSKLSN